MAMRNAPVTKVLLAQGEKKVWFIRHGNGPVLVNWVFTGLKQKLPRNLALAIYYGLRAFGFQRVV
jgi:hypothetical protein